MPKSATAYRTISEVAAELNVQPHVLRFWETKFQKIQPLKRRGGRRYYSGRDIELLQRIRKLLYAEGYTIKGVQRLLKKRLVEDAVDPAEMQDNAPAGVSNGQGYEPMQLSIVPEPAQIPLPVRQEIRAIVKDLEELQAILLQ